jgi:hypothetical protein
MRRGMPPVKAVQRSEGLGVETRHALPADGAQAVLDVATCLVAVERPEVIRGDDALAQLLHVRALQDAAEFRLAEQEGLDQRAVVVLEVGQHAQFLDRARRQVLRLVDHQQGALALARGHGEKILEVFQQRRLGQAFVLQAERGGDAAQGVFGVELGRHQLRRDQVLRVELAEQVAHQRGLAGADLAGDDDEALAQRQAVVQIRHRPLVPLGPEEESADRG